jgi:DNA end-binding protein Ku
LKQAGKVAIGQLIMQGRGHMVGIKAHGRGLMLSILRYGNEVRQAEPYFENLTGKVDSQAVTLAKELIKRMSGRFEPEKMPDEYARAVKELVQAKIEQRAPEVQIAPEGKAKGAVINIMDALKASMQKQGQAKVREAVGKRMGKAAPKQQAARPTPRARSTSRRELH